jgi:hypothetical protein
MSKKFLRCVPRDDKEKPSHGKFRYRHEGNSKWMDEMHNLCLMTPQNTSKRTSNASFSMRILNSCMKISLYGRMALVNALACRRVSSILGVGSFL